MQVARNDLRCFREQRECDRLREGAIERDANGDIVRVTVPKVNIADYRGEGIDAELNATADSGAGKFEVTLRASRVMTAELLAYAGAPPIDQLGVFGHPRWRASADLGWRRDRHAAGIGAQHIAGQAACFEYLQQDGTREPACAYRIASYTTLDAYWTWESPWRARVTLGARNLANRPVPLMPKEAPFAGNFSYGLYDPMDRVLYLRYVQAF